MQMEYVPGVLMGMGIGEALGLPFESLEYNVHPKLKEWRGGFTTNIASELIRYPSRLPLGSWGENTEISLALAESLISTYEFDGKETATSYLHWHLHNPAKNELGHENLTESLSRLQDYSNGVIKDEIWKVCGTKFDNPEEVGSETAARAAVLGVSYCEYPNALRKVCREDAYITHAHKEAYAASLVVAALTMGFIRNKRRDSADPRGDLLGYLEGQLLTIKDTLVYQGVQVAIEEYLRVDPAYFVEVYAGCGGYAWQIISTSLFCVLCNASVSYPFDAAIEMAVKMGGNTRTRGAIVGALMGARGGLSSIPYHYKKEVVRGSDLEDADYGIWGVRCRKT